MSFALILVIVTFFTGICSFINFLYRRKKAKDYSKALAFCASFFSVFLIVLLLRSFLIEPFRIPSGSLEPTLLVGDFLVVNKFTYGVRLPVLEKEVLAIGKPKTADIAIFRWPPDPSYDYIKRVIGIPGDSIRYQNKKLIINGKEMPQKFIKYTIDPSSGRPVALYEEILNGVPHALYIREDVPAVDFAITVPQDQYFMMGDNRDDSADSRYWGFVPFSYLRGKAMMVWMSFDGKNHRVRWSRIGKIIQ